MFDSEILSSIYADLKSHDPGKLIEACDKVRKSAGKFDPSQIREVADALTSLFYIDTGDHPELTEVIDCAVESLAALGPHVVDILIEDLTDTDLKANILIARTLGQIGVPAAAVLRERFRYHQDPYQRSLALFALSKMSDPSLLDIFPEVVSALDHENPELRDTAARTIGKLVDCLGDVCLSPVAAAPAFEKLITKLSDPNAGTRSKVVRSIGKIAAKGYLDDDQKRRAIQAVTALLGIDGKHEWDRAFIVRKEAEEAYRYLTGNDPATAYMTGEGVRE